MTYIPLTQAKTVAAQALHAEFYELATGAGWSKNQFITAAANVLDSLDTLAVMPGFAPGARVRYKGRQSVFSGLVGVVVRITDLDGEVHTVHVRWSDRRDAMPMSPVELEVIE